MDGDESALGGATTSRRVVSGRGGGGPSLALVVLVVAALVGAGVVLTRGDDDPATPGGGDDEAADPTSGAEMEVVKAADVSAVYAEAAVRFGRAHTFGYRGTVRSAGPSRVRPGPWISEEVTVEGAVHLPLSITTEVAVDPSGAAVETVTSGPATWARRAPGADGLAGASWEAVRGVDPSEAGPRLPEAPASRLGIALVVDAVQPAADRREAPRDEAGRRVVRATVPDSMSRRSAGPDDLDDLIGGAELAVTLDDDGDIARVELTSAPGHPLLDLALDIVRLGDPDLVAPADLAGPVRGSVPADVLAEVGLGSLDVPALPDGWALTNASVHRPDGRLSPVPPGCGGPVLWLEYHDLRAVAEGRLWLSVRRDTCDPNDGSYPVTGPYPEAFTAGRFTGSAYPSTGDPYRGTVTDGTTAVSFTTDLSGEEAATALSSLVPAGPAG